MAIIKKNSFYNKSYVSYFSTANSFVFEYPYRLYGTNHSYISQSKELKIIVPKIAADYYFICTSDSLGILFLDRPAKIYITLPVYEQLLLKLEQMPKYLHYNDESIKGENVYVAESANIEMFKKSCIFINHNQVVEFYRLEIRCVTSGSFIGWSNWIVNDLHGRRKYGIVKNINYLKRFSNVPDSLKCDYIVLFDEVKRKVMHERKTINLLEFTDIIIDNVKEERTIIVPVEMTTVFLELIMHVLSTLEKNRIRSSIAVCSPIYTKLNSVINIQSEWLNNKFSNTVCKGKEPFNFNEYPHFSSHNSIYDLPGPPQILFIDELEYSILNVDRIFPNQIVIAVNTDIPRDYTLDIKLEATYEEILDKNPYTTFVTTQSKEKAIALEDGEYLCFEEYFIDRVISIKNANKIDVSQKGNKIQFYIEGCVHNKDETITIEATKGKLKELFYNKHYTKIDGRYYFPSENIFIKITDDKCIVD